LAAAVPAQVPAQPRPDAAIAKSGGWLVQVGAFSSRDLAQTVAAKAAVLVGTPDAATVVASPSGARFYARITGLDSASAKTTCARVVAGGMPCFPVSPSAS
jgi:hypothetical protein